MVLHQDDPNAPKRRGSRCTYVGKLSCMPRITLLDRLLDSIDSCGHRTTAGCLLWAYSCPNKLASNDLRGYGMVSVHGHDARVTRVVYHHYVDPTFPIWYDPETRLILDHLCRITSCYEPTHLDPVPQSTNTERGRLSGLKPGKASQHTGVSWDATRGLWLARIRHNGVRRNLGRFDSEAAAARAYEAAL